MFRFVVIVSAAFCLAGSSQAQQQADPQNHQETIQTLRQEINELKARVAALEAGQSKTEPPAASASTTNAPAEVPSPGQSASTPANSPEPFGFHRGIKLQGFGSVTYKASDANPPDLGASLGFRPGSAGNFAVGDIDLFLTSQFSLRSSILSEVVFSEQSSGEFETDVERLLLKFDPGDYLKMSFGRFHTATSYYNSVFHHGLWLQTAADRPLIVEFSDHGGLLPSQAVGGSFTGRLPSGSMGLNYIVEYGSAATIRPQITSPDAPEIEEHNSNEITAGMFLQPDWLPGLDVGGSFYHDHINPEGSNIHIAQAIGSVHAVYNNSRFEFLNEAFVIQHKVEETGQTFNTPAFYTLISRKLGDRWRPYFRYQYTNAATGSPVFPDVGLRHGPSAGIRFDANDYVALKAQYDRTFRRDLSDFNDVLGQLAFRF